MSRPHVIRLRGPWLCWPTPTTPASEETALTVDCRDQDGLVALASTACQERVLFGRRFHRPTGLTDETPIQLVIETCTPNLTLSLNSKPLGAIATGRHAFDLSAGIQLSNQLRIEVPAESARSHRSLTDLFCCQLEIG